MLYMGPDARPCKGPRYHGGECARRLAPRRTAHLCSMRWSSSLSSMYHASNTLSSAGWGCGGSKVNQAPATSARGASRLRRRGAKSLQNQSALLSNAHRCQRKLLGRERHVDGVGETSITRRNKMGAGNHTKCQSASNAALSQRHQHPPEAQIPARPGSGAQTLRPRVTAGW